MKSLSIEKSHPATNLAVIGNNLLALRKSTGLARAVVAYQANLSLTTLYRLEKGKCHSVGFLKLIAICNYYGVKPAEVVIEGYFTNPDQLK